MPIYVLFHELAGLLSHRMVLNQGFVIAAYSGYPLKLYFQIPCVFPVQLQIFPVPIYIMCDYYIHKTDLADLSSFWEKMDFFAENIAISFTFRIRVFVT